MPGDAYHMTVPDSEGEVAFFMHAVRIEKLRTANINTAISTFDRTV